MSKKQFKFSVIIPIYNVEEYLEETLNSIINQTIGFEDNIQLVLINDGSPDNSEGICLKYKREYPDNIVYFKQKNSGVSVARNKGIELAEGEFINFLDSDDLWSKDSFEIVYQNIMMHPDISLFSCKMIFFEGRKGNHQLNYKYKENKIINILEDYEYPQLSSCSIFIKKDAIASHRYDKNIKYSEDNKFINEILLDTERMMLLKEPIYYYRRRATESSAIQNQLRSYDWYLVTPKEVYKYLFDLSKKKYGKIIKYIQYLVMYDVQWRLKEKIQLLNDKEKKEYISIITKLLKQIDEEIISIQRNLSAEYKILALSIRNGEDILKKVEIVDNIVMYNGIELFSLNKNTLLKINVINIYKDGKVNITGTWNGLLQRMGFKLFCRQNGEILEINEFKTEKENICDFTDIKICNQIFDITIDSDIEELEFFVKNKRTSYSLNFSFTIHGRLHHKFKTYFSKYDKMIYLKKNKLFIKDDSIIRKLYFNFMFFTQLLLNKRFPQLIYRLSAKFVGIFKRKKIWLISDRTAVANDNGMHFFKYITAQNNKSIDAYFVIDKQSKDYSKMKEYGKVLAHNSFKYKIYFLLADKIISSQADGWVINAFGKSERFYRDLYRFDFIFLQHGIIQNDLSGWLNKIDKNIKLFVTSTTLEAKSILEVKNYIYDSSIVKITGMPRYDNLTDNKKKMIAIMPTWRKKLAGKVDAKVGLRMYNPYLKKSDYFKFYNSLINDKRLIKTMEKYGYKGIFVLHPSHEKNVCDFEGNKCFEIINGFADYQKIFKEASLLVSDYSSVLFDFAYLRKPIIYSQFDKEDFFSLHMFPEGYFKTDRDGFGPVITDYEEVVDEIIRNIQNECVLSEKYLKRINSFYKYNDTNCCCRVYDEILKMK